MNYETKFDFEVAFGIRFSYFEPCFKSIEQMRTEISMILLYKYKINVDFL